MKWTLLFCLCTSSVFATEVTHNRVYDGDTFFVPTEQVIKYFPEEIGIRVLGLDTPEIRGKCPKEKTLAKQARDRVKELLKSGKVELHNVEPDKYFRLLANVTVAGKPLEEYLIEEGLARPYDGGKRESWCPVTQ